MKKIELLTTEKEEVVQASEGEDIDGASEPKAEEANDEVIDDKEKPAGPNIKLEITNPDDIDDGDQIELF